MIKEQLEELTSSTGDQAIVEVWTKEIENADLKEKSFRDEANKYFAIYKDEKEITDASGSNSSRYNVFWANVQTLRPLVFSKLPNPNVTRRFLAIDDNSRILSEMMERSLSFCLEDINAEPIFNAARDDFLIGGRGVVRVIYDPGEVLEIEDEETGEIGEEVDYDSKKIRLEYVNWEDIRISPESTWEKVRWITFRHKLNKTQLTKQFGKAKANKVNFNLSLEQDSKNSNDDNDLFKYAEVWEVWDKQSERVIFVTTGGGGVVLSDEEDTYNLKNFFPIACPLGSYSNPNSLIPIPLYRFYRGQAEELNRIDSRIKSLVEQCKYTGIYAANSESPDIRNLLNGLDGQFTPMTGVMPGSDIKNSIFVKDLNSIITTIAQLNDQKSRIIQNIRDITGISDIVRGTTFASETATAQRLKGDFAISRIQPLQRENENFVRDNLRLLSEVLVENYSITELAKMTGLQIVDVNTIAEVTRKKLKALMDEAMAQIDLNSPEGQQQAQQLKEQAEIGFKKTMEKPLNDLKGYAVTPEQLQEIEALMKDDKLRTFAIDVETDSTVKVDQNQQKQDRLEYIQAISGFFGQVSPILQIGGISKATFKEMLGFMSAPFKVGRNLEESLLAEEEEEPKGPSIEEQLAQAENQRKDQELQLKAQSSQVEADQNQQKIDIEKAKVKLSQIQFEDKIDFEDVNKAADRQARSDDQMVKLRTERVNDLIRNSNLLG